MRKTWTVKPKAESWDSLVSWYRHASGNKAKLITGSVLAAAGYRKKNKVGFRLAVEVDL
jgi:hypothetical protein